MLDFMVIGLPRSGTTWAANWLTTDHSTCLHDPLYHTHYSEWDSGLGRFKRGYCQRVGISCTGIWRWADWVNAHPARKVVLLRDPTEVQHSMAQIAMEGYVGEAEAAALRRVEGLHVQHVDLFGDKARARAHAGKNGAPVLSGTDGAVDAAGVKAFFAKHRKAGIVIKAIAGGGGRGMRVVTQESEIEEAFARASAEAQATDEAHRRLVRISGLHVQFTEAMLNPDPVVRTASLLKFLADAKGLGVIYIGPAPHFLDQWARAEGLN